MIFFTDGHHQVLANRPQYHRMACQEVCCMYRIRKKLEKFDWGQSQMYPPITGELVLEVMTLKCELDKVMVILNQHLKFD